MPSLRHELLSYVVPRVRGARDLDDLTTERARLEGWHATLDRSLPTRLTPGLARDFEVEVDTSAGFAVHVLTPRSARPERTLVWMPGGGYVAPTDALHVRYTIRLARRLGARVVIADYPLAPEHTWRDSHAALVAMTARWCTQSRVVLGGDSAGGGLALALAQSLRDAGAAQPEHLLLISPWVDLTTSTPATRWFAARDPWLFASKLSAYAGWWAGDADDLARPEVSPALGELGGLPPALMFCGTRDLLVPGCRLLATRAAATDWDLTYVEEPDLIHVYPLLPGLPEARRAWRLTLEHLT